MTKQVYEQNLIVAELRGSYPALELPEDIDLDGLAEDLGFRPKLVTLPIAKINSRSVSNRVYTEQAVRDVVDAVNSERLEGAWGHLRDEERPYAYVAPSIRWVHAELVGDTAWGLGIPLDEGTDRYFRAAARMNAKVGTSTYGLGTTKGREVIDYKGVEKIDIADPTRVGIPDTAAIPRISEQTNDEGDGMEIKLKDVPESVRKQIIEQAQAENAGERLSEMQETVEQLKEQTETLQEQNDTLTQERDAARGEMSALLANYARSKIAEQVQLKPVQRLVERTVGIQEMDEGLRIDGAATMEAVDEAIEAALADEDMQALNKEAFAEMFGPKHTPPAHNRNKDNDGGGSGLTMIPG